MPISSPHNPRVKLVRGLLGRRRERTRTGLFAAEGEDVVAAGVRAGWPVESLLVAAGSEDDLARAGIAVAGATTVDPALLDSVSALGSGTRVIGVFAQRWTDVARGPRCLHLHGVRDAGNVGTAIRSAHALGASSVSLGPGSADPFGPRAVRASMGSVFAVSLARVADPADLPGTTVALDVSADERLRADAGWVRAALSDRAPGGGISLVVGAERHGLSTGVLVGCDHAVRLPIAGAESLNAAMAATIALYELAR